MFSCPRFDSSLSPSLPQQRAKAGDRGSGGSVSIYVAHARIITHARASHALPCKPACASARAGRKIGTSKKDAILGMATNKTTYALASAKYYPLPRVPPPPPRLLLLPAPTSPTPDQSSRGPFVHSLSLPLRVVCASVSSSTHTPVPPPLPPEWGDRSVLVPH